MNKLPELPELPEYNTNQQNQWDLVNNILIDIVISSFTVYCPHYSWL